MPTSIFHKLSRYVQDTCGIQLPIEKKTMVEGRIRKRMKALGISDFTDYYRLAFDHKRNNYELVHMVDALTTNKTHFFRESAHFEYLQNNLVSSQGTVNAWSAGCSSGEEVYTLAIVLSNILREGRINNFKIVGSDISTKVLQTAAQAVYPESAIDGLPLTIKKRYFLRSKDRMNKTVKISSGIREKVQFQKLNLMDNIYRFPFSFDIIFCRNVLIYFNKTKQSEVIAKLTTNLCVGGLLFLGHSESLPALDDNLIQIQPTIYQRR
ncbi:MAG: CheR family methyltransferase [Bacteroidota bacterium]